LNASLVAIHERLDAIEARCLNNHRKEAIAAAFHDLEDLRRRYQAGQYLWSGDGLFDSQAVIGTCLDRLLQRVQQVEERMADNDGSDTTPPRPSSLSLVNSHRPSSANANRNVITTAATGINLSPTDLYLERSSSPPTSVYQRATDAATTAVSTEPETVNL
uniref:Esa1-associated factor 6 homolog n=1 Tax=Hydatigena taeniaeformis TaxID=6205 RepID=A0A0R3WVQ4_HYDTA